MDDWAIAAEIDARIRRLALVAQDGSQCDAWEWRLSDRNVGGRPRGLLAAIVSVRCGCEKS